MPTDSKPAIHLQRIGLHIAKPAGEIQVGDILVWNYWSTSSVVSVREISKCFVEVSSRSENGIVYPRRMKKDRLVAWSPKATAAAQAEMGTATSGGMGTISSGGVGTFTLSQ